MVFHVDSFYRVQLCSHSLSLMRAFVSMEALVNSLRLHFTARRLIANIPGLLGHRTSTLPFGLGPQLSSSLQEFLQLHTCVDMDTGSRWLRNRYKIQTGGLEPISLPEPNQGSPTFSGLPHFLRARELPFPDVALVSFIPSALDRQFLDYALGLKSEVTPWAKSCYQTRIISYEVSRILYI